MLSSSKISVCIISVPLGPTDCMGHVMMAYLSPTWHMLERNRWSTGAVCRIFRQHPPPPGEKACFVLFFRLLARYQQPPATPVGPLSLTHLSPRGSHLDPRGPAHPAIVRVRGVRSQGELGDHRDPLLEGHGGIACKQHATAGDVGLGRAAIQRLQPWGRGLLSLK